MKRIFDLSMPGFLLCFLSVPIPVKVEFDEYYLKNNPQITQITRIRKRGYALSGVALPSEFTRHVGNQDYLRGIYGLTVDGIVENTIALLKNGC